MNKNIKYIIGLISIICISVVIHGCVTNKKEGYTSLSCIDLKKSIVDYFNTSHFFITILTDIKNNKKIDFSMLNNSDNEGLVLVFSFIYIVDTFILCMKQYPTFFTDLFENKNITDDDFVVMFQFYNIVNTILMDANLTLLRMDYKTKPTINMPITNLEIVKIDNKTMLDSTNAIIKDYILIMKKVSDTIYNKNNIRIHETDEDFGIVTIISSIRSTIKNLKKCDLKIVQSIPKPKQQIIFPFLRLIRSYIYVFSQSLNKYFVPALNKKLKNGQQIPIQNITYKPSVNENGPSVLVDTELTQLNMSILSEPTNMLTTGFINTG